MDQKDNFDKVHVKYSEIKDEIEHIFKAIDFTYDYLENIMKEEKSENKTEQS
jgi:hypothetical protein